MSTNTTFNTLGLNANLLKALAELGYESPTPVQEQSIPILTDGTDLLAQAQTGTGKTAAFSLPILNGIKVKKNSPQALIIAPTRELAIQVAEAFQSYAKHLKGFHVAAIYGGQDYQIQLRALKRGAHVIVGTPGRIMDHLRRGTLVLDELRTVVLDEADEMLKMGFIDDIEWILQKIPGEHQTALFSATMPNSIEKIAKRYLQDAERLKIKPQQSTVEQIEQCYIHVSRNNKLDVLTRFLEVEEMQAAIIFARTKTMSAELAEKLQARGYVAAALNGDMAQAQRKKVIERIKKGTLDIIVATDVAARGIDVDRITHVINYDIPYDTESYTHRIGRTGRAGRSGKALLFVTPREHRLLNDIKREAQIPLKRIEPPTIAEMTAKRSQMLTDKVINIIAKSKRLAPFQALIADIQQQSGNNAEDIAAALAYLIEQANPLTTQELDSAPAEPERKRKKPGSSSRPRKGKPGGARTSDRKKRHGDFAKTDRRKPKSAKPNVKKQKRGRRK